jgi:hypothetical protein
LDADILGDALGQLNSLMAGLEVIQQLSDVVSRLAALTQSLQQQSKQLGS